jgi:hypothetical protein
LFLQKDKKTLQWSIVAESMKGSNVQGTFVKESNLKQQCSVIAKIIPDWISMIVLCDKTLVKQMRKF